MHPDRITKEVLEMGKPRKRKTKKTVDRLNKRKRELRGKTHQEMKRLARDRRKWKIIGSGGYGILNMAPKKVKGYRQRR